MAQLSEIFQQLDTAVKNDSSYLKDIHAVYQFQFHDDDAVYQLILHDENRRVVEGTQETSNCTMVFVTEDFVKLTEGSLNGTQAFMSGRLKIKGDKGLALKLQSYLSSLKKAAK